jgi:hypothetical protein
LAETLLRALGGAVAWISGLPVDLGDCERVPLRPALWLVEHHPDYFYHDPRPWLRRAPARARATVWALDDLLARAWIRRALSGAPDAPVAFTLHAIRVARDAMINQREVKAEIREGIHDGHFWLSATARLVRGQVNCEGQNHLLARLLSHRLGGVELFETRSEARQSTHTLVRVRLGGRAVMADAWSDAPLFHLEESWPDGPAEVPSYEDLRARGMSFREGIQPRAEYEAGRTSPLRRSGRLFTLIGEPDGPPPPPGSVGPDDPRWQRYLIARAHHVFGAPEDAAAMYAELARGDPRCPIAVVTSRWIARLESNQGAFAARARRDPV